MRQRAFEVHMQGIRGLPLALLIPLSLLVMVGLVALVVVLGAAVVVASLVISLGIGAWQTLKRKLGATDAPRPTVYHEPEPFFQDAPPMAHVSARAKETPLLTEVREIEVEVLPKH